VKDLVARRDIVVIGASAGGVAALMRLVADLPASFAAPVLVVVHVAPHAPSSIPKILGRCTSLPVAHAVDGEEIEPGRIYVAPPDRHLLVDHRRVLVRKGPKENRFRPSVDALFRSAAYLYGSRVVGVVLSGALDDGTSGMWAIKQRGGTTVVQEPSDAEHTGMPESVLQHVRVDHVAPVREMGALLRDLVAAPSTAEAPALAARETERLELEVAIARGDNAFEMGMLEAGELSPFTCPECHGALVRLSDGPITRLRCHTGHAYTASALLASVTEAVEESLWQSMQRAEEATMLLNHMAEHLDRDGDHAGADLLHEKAHATAEQARTLHAFIERHEQLSNDSASEARTLRPMAAASGNGGSRARPSG
jgi:two-component system, chemotaxis family, protein-glutamate methylesterase/glutaminase